MDGWKGCFWHEAGCSCGPFREMAEKGAAQSKEASASCDHRLSGHSGMTRPLLAQSGHCLVHCTCPLLTQSGHQDHKVLG